MENMHIRMENCPCGQPVNNTLYPFGWSTWCPCFSAIVYFSPSPHSSHSMYFESLLYNCILYIFCDSLSVSRYVSYGLQCCIYTMHFCQIHELFGRFMLAEHLCSSQLCVHFWNSTSFDSLGLSCFQGFIRGPIFTQKDEGWRKSTWRIWMMVETLTWPFDSPASLLARQPRKGGTDSSEMAAWQEQSSHNMSSYEFSRLLVQWWVYGSGSAHAGCGEGNQVHQMLRVFSSHLPGLYLVAGLQQGQNCVGMTKDVYVGRGGGKVKGL